MVFSIFLLASCNTLENEELDKSTSETINQLKEIKSGKETEIIIPREPEIYTASVSAIGDILIHNAVYEDANIAPNEYDFSKMFELVKPLLESTDLTIANSESIIGGQEIGLSSYPQFNSPYEVGDVLKDVGVDVVTMANNHTLDRGEQAIINATNYWDKLGITYVGAATSQKEADIIKTMTINNIVFSFLSYTYGTNGLKTPEGKEYLVNYIDEEKMIEDISEARKMSDVVIVNLHNGNEYARMFNEEQERIVQLASDYGADIVFGHHPHVLQPAKWYTGVNGNKTFVIHSLGNFISAQDKLYRQIGAIIQLDITKTISYDKKNNEIISIDITNPALIPTYVRFSNWKNFKIIPMYQLNKDDLNDHQELYEEIKSHMSQFVPEIQYLEPVNSK
ncbi:MAG TPA: CapA family protein [Ureibacillus sp.]|nr:CapA family protein [Ureibacillus sp.]